MGLGGWRSARSWRVGWLVVEWGFHDLREEGWRGDGVVVGVFG